MKKIAFALVALLVALSPLAAGESWIGVTTGPAFEIQVTDDLTDVGATDTTVTDFNWDINLEGAYYFDEAETIGIGARLGVGIYYGSTFEFKNETLMGLAAELGAGMIPEDTSAEQQMALSSIPLPTRASQAERRSLLQSPSSTGLHWQTTSTSDLVLVSSTSTHSATE